MLSESGCCIYGKVNDKTSYSSHGAAGKEEKYALLSSGTTIYYSNFSFFRYFRCKITLNLLSLDYFKNFFFKVERERLRMQAESEVIRMLTRKANEGHESFSASESGAPLISLPKKFQCRIQIFY